jgi:hypothetical protein
VKGTPESGKIRLVESRKIAKEKRENSDAMRMLLRPAQSKEAEAPKRTKLLGGPASAPALKSPVSNLCAATARRLEEIAERNSIREEAGLPLLSIAKELRRMKKAADAAEFEAFAALHNKPAWDEVLAPERERRGEPDYRPRTFMEGLAFQAEVSKILHQRYLIIATFFGRRAPHLRPTVGPNVRSVRWTGPSLLRRGKGRK